MAQTTGGKTIWMAGAAAVLAAVLAAAILVRGSGPAPAYPAPGFSALTAEDAVRESYRLAPDMLQRVYEAFAETEEAAIYDALAEVAGGEALQQLYLERVGAMADGGLTEPDQAIHEMRLISLDTSADGERVHMDATWRVIGTVGHAEHLHVRGNVYTAGLTMAPVDGAWRFTGFDLRDVDRTDAGSFVPAEDGAAADDGDDAAQAETR